ncbi:MAG: hypothetical protein H0T51_15050, partial [Pirellulales bacterium]|nr:hypothetical protein [Pirellulales bacterium]
MAIIRWVGGAPAVRDKWTLTVAGVWASGDVARVSIGVKDLLITLGASASVAVADIAAEIVNAINAADNTAPGTGFTWNFGGQEYLEFREIAATLSGATVIITATAAYTGVPIGVTSGETTVGTGTVTAVNTIPATGPNFINNADNYLGGVIPVDNDVLYFDTGAVSALYGLTTFRDGNIDLDVVITNDWTGALGLPAINVAGSYAEYRQRYFQYRGGSKTLTIEPGLLGNTNVGNVYVDLQDQVATTISINANRGSSTLSPTIYICGADAAAFSNDLSIAAGA